MWMLRKPLTATDYIHPDVTSGQEFQKMITLIYWSASQQGERNIITVIKTYEQKINNLFDNIGDNPCECLF